MKAILSIDGGGMRGIIPALFLQALEQRAGRYCAELFDMIAGTSTGGILALGLTRPSAQGGAYSAADLVDLYRTRGQDIFSRSAGYELETGWGATGPKYPSTGIEQVLQQYFGDAKLNEALVPVLIPSYETQGPGPYFFKSWIPEARDFLMRDVARATSAAPTYFPPLQAGPRTFIDGGVFANNPAMCAWASASELSPERDMDVLVVSLGTGTTEKRENPVGWGLGKWAPALIDIFMDGNSDTVDYQVRELVGRFQDRYFRFQTDLGGVGSAMDDASPEMVGALTVIANAMIAKNSPIIDQLVRTLA